MTIPYRPLALGLLTLSFSVLILGRAQAGGSHYYPPVTDPVVKEECGSYLVANAADKAGQPFSSKLLRGVSAANTGSTPLRITELPRWVKEHRKVPDWEWKHKDVRSKTNCVACHADAELGYYND